MIERPILFSASMVRALLDGTKTQTRRVLKPQPQDHHWKIFPDYDLKQTGPLVMGDGRMGVRFHHTIPHNPQWDHEPWALCPYGSPGTRLWVRETWMPDPPRDGSWPSTAYDGCKPQDKSLIPPRFRTPAHCIHRATWQGHELSGWTPAIHMNRWASRINLEITGVRVERLQDISEADAKAEGATPAIVGQDLDHLQYRAGYQTLWETINGAGSWAANPWVWVVEFKRTEA